MANGVSVAKNEPTAPSFWRDEALPFIEARSIEDGRSVCYGKHAHSTFSIGAVTGGESTYLNGKAVERIGRGAVVVINPEQVHACNPLDNRLWAYRMIYADVTWLSELQRDLGMRQSGDFHAFSPHRHDTYAIGMTVSGGRPSTSGGNSGRVSPIKATCRGNSSVPMASHRRNGLRSASA